jgi:Fe-S-cluster containining protein
MNSNQRLLICSERCGGKCCRSTPPALTSEDIVKINEYISNDEWIRIIGDSTKESYAVEKRNKTNDCFFLTEKNRCKIYDIKPLDCKLFPIFIKIKENNTDSYKVKWLVWHCPLTEEIGVEKLLKEAKEIILGYLEDQPKILFEYQSSMYESGGYKKKHFMREEIITISKRV